MSRIDGPSPAVPQVRPLFRSLGIAASGLSAQRARMDVIAMNIANAGATSTPEGGAYRRKVVQLAESAMAEGGAGASPGGAGAVGAMQLAGEAPAEMSMEAPEGPGGGVMVAGVVEDTTPGQLVYDPGHPDANADGYVMLSNVNVTDEMIDMLDARRSYEANATVFQALKSMLRRAAQI